MSSNLTAAYEQNKTKYVSIVIFSDASLRAGHSVNCDPEVADQIVPAVRQTQVR